MSPSVTVRVFVYGTQLRGEPHHGALAQLEAKPGKTAEGYSLVELGPLAALVEEGRGVVVGELYDLDRDALMALTRDHAHAGLFLLGPVRLDDGTSAETLLLSVDRARGKRRIKGGDWRLRFGGGPGGLPAGPLVSWARRRP